MTISRVHLFNVERDEPEEAELWDAITEQQLTDWEGEWMPELFKAVQRLQRAGVERRHWPQSRHWDWRKKTEKLQRMLAWPGFSIVSDGMTQGMMLADTTTKRCRINNQKGRHLVYVEYNAPWNRKELSPAVSRRRQPPDQSRGRDGRGLGVSWAACIRCRRRTVSTPTPAA